MQKTYCICGSLLFTAIEVYPAMTTSAAEKPENVKKVYCSALTPEYMPSEKRCRMKGRGTYGVLMKDYSATFFFLFFFLCKYPQHINIDEKCWRILTLVFVLQTQLINQIK